MYPSFSSDSPHLLVKTVCFPLCRPCTSMTDDSNYLLSPAGSRRDTLWLATTVIRNQLEAWGWAKELSSTFSNCVWWGLVVISQNFTVLLSLSWLLLWPWIFSCALCTFCKVHSHFLLFWTSYPASLPGIFLLGTIVHLLNSWFCQCESSK